MSKKMRVTSTLSAWLVGANKRIQIPADSFVVIDEAEAGIGTLLGSPDLEGMSIKISSDMYSVLADADEEETKRAYKESITRCLDRIQDFENLPVVDSGTPRWQIRDLGLASEWCSDSTMRNWMHHVNMKITHPSLSVEKAVFPNNELHFILVLTQTW